MKAKNFALLILTVIAVMCLFALFGCNTVKKSQKSTKHDISLLKFDSSFSKAVTVIDTSITANTLQVTTTTIVYDEPEVISNDSADYIESCCFSGNLTDKLNGGGNISIGPRFKAKKITVTTTSSKTSATVKKGESTVTIEANKISTIDSVATVQIIEKAKETKSNKVLFASIFALIALAGLAFYIVYRKEKSVRVLS